MLVAIQTALLVQATFIAALLLPETIVPIAMRFSVGVISVPVSALCGTIMFGRRNPGSSPGRKAAVFCGLVIIIVVGGLLIAAATGNYDLP